MFAEFAIALPLLILLGWGLATVGAKFFYLGKIQLADYVMEEEVQEVLSRLIYDARAAYDLDAVEGSPTLTFRYRTVKEVRWSIGSVTGTPDGDVIADRKEPRVYRLKDKKIYYQRQTDEARSPITGGNYFGMTEVENFYFKFDKATKILYVTLEMKSLDSLHKIKIDTAVYVPGYEG